MLSWEPESRSTRTTFEEFGVRRVAESMTRFSESAWDRFDEMELNVTGWRVFGRGVLSSDKSA